MEVFGNYREEIAHEAARLNKPENILGKALSQPFADSNSGARKLLYSVQYEHALPLREPEVACLTTGYENRYGELTSSIIIAQQEYQVVGKIEKFMDKPGFHYYLILWNQESSLLKMHEVISYKHIGESYGYRFNNEYADSLKIGDIIPPNNIIRKSTSYDNYMNRTDGVNLLALYNANDITKEDGMLISTVAARKLATTFYRKITINVPENSLLLNTYGDAERYQTFPNIGQMISNGIVCALRQEKTETALYTQSITNLSKILLSDDKYCIKEGMVVDIDIKCNNPQVLSEKESNCQLLKYYNDKVRFMKEFVAMIDNLKKQLNPAHIDYDLDKMYNDMANELNGMLFLDQKVYTGTIIQLMVEEYNIADIGDKITNRYGGKGVISRILPPELMPRIKSTGEPVELVINSSTCSNRENIGQWHELSITHIGKCICDYFRMNILDDADMIQIYVKYLSHCSIKEALAVQEMFNHMDSVEKHQYLQSITEEGKIYVSMKPISESVTLDDIASMYVDFPWAGQREMEVPMKNSVGGIRYKSARRKVTVGYMYIYRLKQYAEEKHSVTALSSTNLKNENSRNKASKNYKALHRSTPIRFGDMETADFGHMGMEYVISNLMIHSVSPEARLLVEKWYTDNPFITDIKLDSNSKNRSAEQVNVYLKSIGYRLVFKKIRKMHKLPYNIVPYTIDMQLKTPYSIFSENQKIVPESWYNKMKELDEEASKYAYMVSPYKFI